ncbi:LLM class flavin-dependent oxidoreductase [Streptomyces mirabilis]|uniref:LLM class flavin-dependent oxidoreductase n=1 Tax=Streptomyces mirabilis TaxID=68239 RepID=UPI0032569164
MIREMHLNAFLSSVGHHQAAWRLPESDPLANTDVKHFQHLARVAERGRLDSLFLADHPGLWGDISRQPAAALEPTVLLTVMAAVTKHIGLIATASTTYNEPFNLARRFASVDHVSGGRVGWNIVTTATLIAARNFGLDELPPHRDRYARADEFVGLARKLWDSWEDDAILADKESGIWGDNNRLHPAAHDGTYFSVAGPLDVARSPQGYPLLVQAGSSEDGRDFAARHADAVFTVQKTLEEAQAFYADLKKRAAQFGRDPETVTILPGIVPTIGATQGEAEAADAELGSLIKPEHAIKQLVSILQVSADELRLDEELPAHITTDRHIEGAQGRYALVVGLARRERLTVRQLIGRLGAGRGHLTIAGTPEQVADTMQHWFENAAADGFNIMSPVLPSGLEGFVDHVVPILQARGLFRTEYSGKTLRDHYGAARPANQYVDELG